MEALLLLLDADCNNVINMSAGGNLSKAKRNTRKSTDTHRQVVQVQW